MLSQIVRPLVATQIRLLANTKATRSTLISTIAQWLSYLGVHAVVDDLNSNSDKIQVALTVSKPEACDSLDWQKILKNIDQNSSRTRVVKPTCPEMSPKQQSKLQRLLAYLIQVGDPENAVDWETISPQLTAMELDECMILGIKSAMKIPQSLDQLMEGIDPDLAAVALPFAVSIAFMDRHVNSHEDRTITALLNALK